MERDYRQADSQGRFTLDLPSHGCVDEALEMMLHSVKLISNS